MRRPRKVDANQKEIVAALRKLGASVEVLSDVGRGVPDLLVGHNGNNYLVEIKSSAEAYLTNVQIAWHNSWNGGMVLTTSDIHEIIEEIINNDK